LGQAVTLHDLHIDLMRVAPGDVIRQNLIVWFTQPVLDLFEKYAEWIPTDNRKSIFLKENTCVRTALAYACEHPEFVPYFGFGFYREDDGSYAWWGHTIVFDPITQTLFDPAKIPTLAFVGVKFGRELWEAMPKNTANPTPTDQLPDVLRTPRYTKS